MKIILLIPIYNDRASLKKLIENINFEIQDLNSEISVVVINDASSQQIIDTYQNLENINYFLFTLLGLFLIFEGLGIISIFGLYNTCDLNCTFTQYKFLTCS